MMIIHRHATRALLFVALLVGVTLSVAVMAWQAPLVRDQIVAGE